MRIRVRVLLLCLNSLLVLTGLNEEASCQSPFFRVLAPSFESRGDVLQTIFQDDQGFIWLGTNHGLYRFDGTDYLRVTGAADSASITALFQSPDGTLWTGSRSGQIFLVRNMRSSIFQLPKPIPAAPVTGITRDKYGDTWFSTYGEGVYCLQGDSLSHFTPDDGLGDKFTYAIAPDSKGNMWVGSDGGISVCSIRGGKKTVIPVTSDEGLPDNIVLSLCPGEGDLMWAGMEDGGICRISLATLKPVVVKVLEGNATGPVNDLYVTGSIVWAASTDRGIVMTDLQSPANSRSFSRFNGTDYTKISRILCDRAGTLWFLAGSDIIQSPGSRIGILSAAGNPVYENIHSLLCDREGNIWFSNDKGLFITRKTGGKQSDPEAVLHSSTHPGLNIISLYEDREGDIWIGTFGSGLFRLDPETRRTTRYTTKNGLANDNILSIAGVDDQIWFATLGGASRCRLPAGGSINAPVRFEGFSQESGLGNNFIYTVFVDSRKRVWFGTDGKGISVYENGKFINYSDSSGFKSKVVYSVTEDQDGHIWFSTSNEGLFEFDMHTFRNYGVKEGLSSLSITSLTGAGKSGIFIVHPEGIDILDPATGMFSYLGRQEGIENINPDLNTLGVNPANEKILVGTSRGIILITPGAFSGFEKPVVRLTGVSIFLEETDTLSEHISAYDRNHFTFAYAGLWYQAPDRVRYQVMLNGYDLDWISTRNTSMVYSSLEPGEYTFRVRASLNDDFSHASTASYHFIIRRPPWKTPWFITMLLLLTGIIIYLVFRAREKRLIREENLSREKIIFQFETLKSQVNPHFLFNSFSTLSAIIDEDREMALDYVQKLSVFFRNILEYQDKSLITLKEELALADTYYYLQKKRYGPSFSVTYDLSPEHLSTYIPPLTLQMILENAVKHNIISTEKPLSVRVYSEGDTLVISNPNQPRPDGAASTGIGLKNIMNRYRLLADKGIEIRGTSQTYTVILPVIKTDLS